MIVVVEIDPLGDYRTFDLRLESGATLSQGKWRYSPDFWKASPGTFENRLSQLTLEKKGKEGWVGILHEYGHWFDLYIGKNGTGVLHLWAPWTHVSWRIKRVT